MALMGAFAFAGSLLYGTQLDRCSSWLMCFRLPSICFHRRLDDVPKPCLMHPVWPTSIILLDRLRLLNRMHSLYRLNLYLFLHRIQPSRPACQPILHIHLPHFTITPPTTANPNINHNPNEHKTRKRNRRANDKLSRNRLPQVKRIAQHDRARDDEVREEQKRQDGVETRVEQSRKSRWRFQA